MQAIVGAALQQRILVLILAAALIAGGLFAYKRLNIEAYPDPVPPLVDIVTQNPGQSSEEIERYITIPIEVQMAGIPFVTSIRTISLTGLSDVKVQFSYDISYREASQLVINRLSQLGPLPNGAQPFISPTSPIGEIFRYRVVGPPGYSVTDLKTIQDWILLRRLKSVPGVIDVTTLGRQEQDLRHHRRPRQAPGLRHHAEAGARRAERRQHQCRRQHGQSRPAVGGDPQRRPDPHHGRYRPHHADGARRLAGAGLRRGDHHGRQRAAAGRGRP